jgi:hypothetical protein
LDRKTIILIGEKMSIVKKLQSLKLPEDAMVTLTYEEGTDVFVHNETEVEDAMNETNVINEFASLIAQTKLDVLSTSARKIISKTMSEAQIALQSI